MSDPSLSVPQVTSRASLQAEKASGKEGPDPGANSKAHFLQGVHIDQTLDLLSIPDPPTPHRPVLQDVSNQQPTTPAAADNSSRKRARLTPLIPPRPTRGCWTPATPSVSTSVQQLRHLVHQSLVGRVAATRELYRLTSYPMATAVQHPPSYDERLWNFRQLAPQVKHLEAFKQQIVAQTEHITECQAHKVGRTYRYTCRGYPIHEDDYEERYLCMLQALDRGQQWKEYFDRLKGEEGSASAPMVHRVAPLPSTTMSPIPHCPVDAAAPQTPS